LRKATENPSEGEKVTDITLNDLEKSLLNKLAEFSKVVARASQEITPHHLCTYLFELASLFNSFYNKHQILNSPLERHFRLQLVEAVAIILQQGLNLLGIKTLEKM